MPTSLSREILDKSLKRRDELRSELEALETFIENYGRVLGADVGLAPEQEVLPDLYAGSTPRAMRRARVADLMMAARRAILAEGRPMKRGELARRLIGQGHEIVGTDKSKVLGTNLWRSGRFKLVEGRGYWPADVALSAPE